MPTHNDGLVLVDYAGIISSIFIGSLKKHNRKISKHIVIGPFFEHKSKIGRVLSIIYQGLYILIEPNWT